jgi:hypothetical protein
MSDEKQAIVASFIAAFVGVCVALSPIWTTMTNADMISVIVTGIAIMIVSVWQTLTKSTIPSLLNGITGAWLIVGALTLGTFTFAILSQIIAGVAVFIFAGWDGAEISHYNREHVSSGSNL